VRDERRGAPPQLSRWCFFTQEGFDVLAGCLHFSRLGCGAPLRPKWNFHRATQRVASSCKTLRGSSRPSTGMSFSSSPSGTTTQRARQLVHFSPSGRYRWSCRTSTGPPSRTTCVTSHEQTGQTKPSKSESCKAHPPRANAKTGTLKLYTRAEGSRNSLLQIGEQLSCLACFDYLAVVIVKGVSHCAQFIKRT
jgi:hypothetical protein